MEQTNEITVALTNNVPPNIPEIPDALEPLVRALPDQFGQVIVWLVTIIAGLRIALAPFSVQITHAFADMMNRAAASSDLEDDEFLRKLYSRVWYRVATGVLRLFSIGLPTLAMLERAVAFQKEAALTAVHESTIARGSAPEA